MLKKKVMLLFALMLLIAPYITVIPLANAESTEESFSVHTDKPEYEVGDIVHVYVKADFIDPNSTITVMNVTVYDPSNSTVVEWRNLSIVLTDTTTFHYVGNFTVTQPGTYTVYATGLGCWRLLWFFLRFVCWLYQHIIPEYPFGPLTAMVVFTAALTLRRRTLRLSMHKRISRLTKKLLKHRSNTPANVNLNKQAF